MKPVVSSTALVSVRGLKFGKMKHGVADLLQAARADQDLQEAYWPMMEAVGKLIKACKDSGDIISGADAEDFLMFLGFLWQIPPTPRAKHA